jgi:D-alanyl-D-alanine carboxypeptidase/D-alanyl-D-alanine-endopeptidase (penicillin-binding protein 4)
MMRARVTAAVWLLLALIELPAALGAAPAPTPAPVPAPAPTPAPVSSAISSGRIATRSVSFVVLDVESGRLAASLNADTPRSPASTIKLVTTFAALDSLGPAYTWHTQALASGTLEDGVLDGDLILKGGGDPYMTLERWWSFVGTLRATGLRSIRGDIVIDETAFALPPEDPAAFDGRPHQAYNAEPDALMVNFQSVEFKVLPNAAARRIDIVSTPTPANLVVDNRIGFTAGRCSGSAARVEFEVPSADWDRVVFSGILSSECTGRSITRVLLSPPSYAFGTFVELWRESGGTFEGKWRIAAAPAAATPLVSFDSLPLADVVRLTNKFSNNLMARHLLLTLGAERFGLPATVDKGIRAISSWSQERGLPLSDMEIDNGSGLSRTARISVLELAAVLRAAHRSRYAPEFIASLPLAGVDGTLRSHMQGVDPGSVRLKTGHLDGVSGVAGYVTGASGKTYVVVSLVNQPQVDAAPADAVHAALVRWVQAVL